MADSDCTACIYLVTNTVNGKQYVGQTRLSLGARWRAHRNAARMQAPCCRVLAHAINKYGPSAFTIEPIREIFAVDQLEVDAAEREAIAEHNALVPNGYNLRSGGHGGALHESTKALMSAAHKGRPKSPEWRAKIGAANRGRRADPAHIEKMNAARIKNGVWVGLTDEIRFKQGSGARGKKQHPNVAEAIRRAHLGAKRSPETRARISAALKLSFQRRKAGAEFQSSHRSAHG